TRGPDHSGGPVNSSGLRLLTPCSDSSNPNRSAARPELLERGINEGRSMKRALLERVLVAAALVGLTLLVAGPSSAAEANVYTATNLVSNGAVPAKFTDTDLVNAWGLVAGPTTPFWVADNGTDL